MLGLVSSPLGLGAYRVFGVFAGGLWFLVGAMVFAWYCGWNCQMMKVGGFVPTNFLPWLSFCSCCLTVYRSEPEFRRLSQLDSAGFPWSGQLFQAYTSTRRPIGR